MSSGAFPCPVARGRPATISQQARPPPGPGGPRLPPVTRRLFAIAALVALVGCGPGAPPPTSPIVPGTSAVPREVNVIAKDWVFLPDPVVVVAGETVLLHVVNGGLDVHEAVIGDASVQAAWEAAEGATIGSPPGPTPLVRVPPDVAGIRIVVASGQRVDVTWTVPAWPPAGLVIGCHIPGHWARGMVVPIEIVRPTAGPTTHG